MLMAMNAFHTEYPTSSEQAQSLPDEHLQLYMRMKRTPRYVPKLIQHALFSHLPALIKKNLWVRLTPLSEDFFLRLLCPQDHG